MIRLSLTRADATVTETETLTAGRVGLECAFTFNADWDGLTKVAVFEGAETIEVALGSANAAVVPPECMATAGYNLRCGAYGLSTEQAVVIPTVWAKAGKIKDSAAPDEESLSDFTPTLAAQVIAKANTAEEIAASLNEQAIRGEFDGFSPYVAVEEIENGHRVSITDSVGTNEFDVMDGADGEDGVSPTIAVSDITGGHRVTITDANGAHTFDVMDGQGGGGGVSEELKQALLLMAQKVAYIDANGQDYYQALYNALYSAAVLTSITAVYTQSGTVYTSDTLDSLKPDLVVTAHYNDNTSEVITNYTLSGDLTVGTSIITVSYGGKTANFNVTVTRVAGTFSISNNLTGCSSSNSATTVAENASYNATITANTGYTLTGATVSITMGGTSVTGYYSNGTISIPNVTGDVVITVAAVAVTVSSISAVFNQGTATIYDTDSLDTLKQYLVVTATYSNGSTATVTNYTLIGTLAVGTSTVTVSYGGKTTTFSVTVTQEPPYTFYDYLQGDGNAYINTGLLGSTYFTLSYDHEIKAARYNAGSTKAIYGVRQQWGAANARQLWWNGSSGYGVNFCASSTTAIADATSSQVPIIVKTTTDKKIYRDGVEVTYTAGNIGTITHTGPITLFAECTGGQGSGYKAITDTDAYAGAFAACRIYYFKVWDSNGDIVADIKPALRKSDNAIGMYDTVRDMFFENANDTGAFSLGNE